MDGHYHYVTLPPLGGIKCTFVHYSGSQGLTVRMTCILFLMIKYVSYTRGKSSIGKIRYIICIILHEGYGETLVVISAATKDKSNAILKRLTAHRCVAVARGGERGECERVIIAKLIT